MHLRRSFVAGALAVALAACGSSSKPAAAPVRSTTTVGARVPTRIVSLSPTATEMLYAIGAGPQVVAVDDQSNYPPVAPKTKLSGYQPNVEAIADKNPDLVVLSSGAVKSQLEKLRIKVLVDEAATTLDDSYRQIVDLGGVTGHAQQAAALVASMRRDIAAALPTTPARTQPATYYYELDNTFYSATSHTFIGSLFTLAGLRNIADAADKDASGYPQLSAEYIIRQDPDYVFLADTKCCRQSAKTVAARPGWSSLTAVKQHRIVELDDDIASRWGPRVVQLFQQIVRATSEKKAA
jgi:iron complex transport system substrate-binding protein